MSLYGESVIQLMDAKSGVVTDEVHSTNLITNAVSNIMSGCWNKRFASGASGYNRLFSLPSGKTFAETFYGGLLVFSKHLSSDANHILPTPDEIESFVGCANQGSSIVSSSFTGILNASETVISDDYCTFVWDFSPEQCNGDIACLCLTSNKGGSLGWGFDAEPSVRNVSIADLSTSNAWDSSVKQTLTYMPYALGVSKHTTSNSGWCYYFDEPYFYFVDRGTCYKMDISKLMNNRNSLRYSCDIASSIKLVDSFDTGVAVYANIPYIADGYGYCRDGDLGTELKLVKYSGDGKAERITIDLTNIRTSIRDYYNYANYSLNDAPRFIWDNKVVFFVGTFRQSDSSNDKGRVYFLNFDGSFTYSDMPNATILGNLLFSSYISTTPVRGVSFNIYQGSLLISCNNASILVKSDGTILDRAIMSSPTIYIDAFEYKTSNIWLPAPYALVDFDSKYLYGDFVLTSYLGTINNQSTVLTKTPDKTMRVIYTLTQK